MTQIIKGFLNFLQGFMYCHHGRQKNARVTVSKHESSFALIRVSRI